MPSTSTNVVSIDLSNSTLEQRIDKFAEALANGYSTSEAYEKAGYSPDKANAHAFRKKHHQAIKDAFNQQIVGFAGLALSTLVNVMKFGKSETAKVKSALEILDRAGYDKTTKIQMGTDKPKTQEELRKELEALLSSSKDQLDIMPDLLKDTD